MSSKEGPIQEHLRDEANAIAQALDQVLNGDERPKKVGFMLLMFDFDGPKSDRINYIANCERRDAINSLKEFIARAEGHISDEEQLQ